MVNYAMNDEWSIHWARSHARGPLSPSCCVGARENILLIRARIGGGRGL